MAYEIIMPVLGMNQDTGIISVWLKQPGDFVEVDEPIMEVETDKVVQEIEASESGYFSVPKYPEGAEVPVGKVIAMLYDTKEEATAIPDEAKDLTGEAFNPKSEELDKRSEEDSMPDTKAIVLKNPPHQVSESPEEDFNVLEIQSTKILASPKAKKTAQNKGISLTDLLKQDNDRHPITFKDVDGFVTKGKGSNSFSTINMSFEDAPIKEMLSSLAQEVEIETWRMITRIIVSSFYDCNVFSGDTLAKIYTISGELVLRNMHQFSLSDDVVTTTHNKIDVEIIDLLDFQNISIEHQFSAPIGFVLTHSNNQFKLQAVFQSSFFTTVEMIKVIDGITKRFQAPLRNLLELQD